jgi:hypothetical protein
MPDLKGLTIFNNFLPEPLQVEVLTVLRQPGWNMGLAPVIRGEDTPPSKLWHMNGLKKNPLFSDTIFKGICKTFQIDFKIQRVYANGQMACQKGNVHADDGDLTFLYYPLQEWSRDWGGNLMFFKGDDVANCVSYVPNRALSFPAGVRHVAEAPSRNYEGLRVSVAWKLLLP